MQAHSATAAKPIPASIRNCNPGSIYPGPSARRFGATTEQALVSQDGKHRIATFPDAISGAAALFDNLCHARPGKGRPYYYRDKTLQDAIETWCGSIHAAQYLCVIEARTGFPPETVLDLTFLRDPASIVPLAKAMAWHEAGKPFPLADGGWERAHEMALLHMPEPSVPAPVAFPVHEVAHAADNVPALASWSPDNDMPSPRPETRVDAAMAGSRKWSLLAMKERILAATGIGVGGMTMLDVADATPSMLNRIKQFAGDNAIILVLTGVVVGLVLVHAVKLLAREDAIDGRYQARGNGQ